MTGTKTGGGGFEIDGKVYDFDVGDPNDPGLEPGQPDHGDIKVDDSKKDLGKQTRSTLGRYLSDATKGKHGYAKGVPNAFTVDPPSTPTAPDEVSTSTAKGLPAPLTKTKNSKRFAENTSGVVADSPGLRADLSPVVADPATTLGSFGKGKQGKKFDGHNLLKDITSSSAPEPVESYRNTVLNTNRFTADKKMSASRSYRIGGKEYSSSKLKQVGVMLSLRGSQEFPAAFKDRVNPVGSGAVAGALLPSPNQLGILKVPNRILEAQDALESLANTNNEPAELDIAPIGNQSWGALNNVEEPWAGMLNIGMIAMALAMQVALLLVFEGLALLIGGAGAPPAASRKANGTYTKGSYTEVPLADPSKVGFPPNLMALLGIRGTRFPFSDALKTGAAAFFVGAEKAKEGLGGQLVGALTQAAGAVLSDNSSAGYIIIVSRMIIRTGQQVAADVSKIGKAFSSNPISGIKSIVSLLENLRRSKLIAAMNIFAMMGDAILSEDEFTKDSDASGSEKSVSTIDAFDNDVVASAQRKHRLKGQTKIAWASNRSPASYLLPDSIATMTIVDSKLGSFRGPLGATDQDSKGVLYIQTEAERSQSGARIPYESTDPEGIDVKKMEMLLEAEYMPFYFHDLRTNEIISFHAFLASLSDDYTANWENVDGYGRVDPVKIYKSTGRKIGMSFYVAALDEKDFDEMWMKINKLITLVYPQYTKGRSLTDGSTTSFVQPFSQLIGASPIIRLRLGDLFRSNYSRFALTRLFGAADGDMVLNSKDIKFSGSPAIIEKLQKVAEKAIEDEANEWHVSSTGWPAADGSGGGISVGIGGGPSTPDQAPTFNVDAGDLQYIMLVFEKSLDASRVIMKPRLMTIEEMVTVYRMDKRSARVQANILELRYKSSLSVTTKVVGGENGYVFSRAALRPTASTLKRILEKAGAADALVNIDSLAQFMDIEKNALVKSFRATQGKGLAGGIETIQFDWYDKVTWDIRPGHRAPKMCKVTLAFAPIHDISPGLDHLGYNRAPVYPVGGAMGLGYDPDKTSG